MERPTITTIILAAGYSERMQRFKPLLDLGGRPVIERVIASFRDAGIKDIRVVAGYNKEELIQTLTRLDVKVIINEHFADGMFRSVQAGGRSLDASTEAFFLMPADVPLVRSATIRYLAESRSLNRDEIMVPVFDSKRGHPPLIASSFGRAIIDYNGQKGLSGVFNLHSSDIVTLLVPDSNILLDMDTPEEYELLCEKSQKMDIPTAAECDEIMRNIRRAPDAVIAHCRAVSLVAGYIVEEINRHGGDIDREPVTAAALLHDLARGMPDHAAKAAGIIREMGFSAVAELVETHMDIVPGRGEEVRSSEILYLADKLVSGDRVIGLQEHFNLATDKYGSNANAANRIKIRHDNAVNILNRVEAKTGTLDIRRLMTVGA
jgi:CTP:molybdopterin cytidylyltransferase MocA/HD superfamily phosphohydrolase YqeK